MPPPTNTEVKLNVAPTRGHRVKPALLAGCRRALGESLMLWLRLRCPSCKLEYESVGFIRGPPVEGSIAYTALTEGIFLIVQTTRPRTLSKKPRPAQSLVPC